MAKELTKLNEIKNLYKKFEIYNKDWTYSIYEDDFKYFYNLIINEDEDLKNNKNKKSYCYKVANRIKRFLKLQKKEIPKKIVIVI
jgi:hypothetical protein